MFHNGQGGMFTARANGGGNLFDSTTDSTNENIKNKKYNKLKK